VRSNVLIPLIFLLGSGCSARTATVPSEASTPDTGPNYDPNLVTVPFLVDDHFIPSGCMGDCTTNVTIDSVCPDRGGEDPQGSCHHFVYQADGDAGAGALGWAGVLWQTVEQNWGSQPGRTVAPGATTMHFYARTTNASVDLTFLVGGMNGADAGKACTADSDCASEQCASNACTAPHQDTLLLSRPKTLTAKPDASWAKFDLSFDGHSYGSEVLSGFGWTAVMPPTAKTIEFYVDDLRWE
jgi:hypothetical protein